MPYTSSLPGDEQISQSSHLQAFHSTYSEESSPQTLYKLQPLFIRFAPIWPRITFLLESLVEIYTGLDDSLFRFYDLYFSLNEYTTANNTKGGAQSVGWGGGGAPIPSLERPMGSSRPADVFEYINAKATLTEKRYCLILVRWALMAGDDDSEESENATNAATKAARFWYAEHAREVLEQARDDDRRSIVEELLSEKTMEMVSQVPIPADTGFWRVRRGIVSIERILDEGLRRVAVAVEQQQQQQRQPQHHRRMRLTTTAPIQIPDGIEYGTDPIEPVNGVNNTYDEPAPGFSHARPRVSFSPPPLPLAHATSSSSPIPRRGRFSSSAAAISQEQQRQLQHQHQHDPWEPDRRLRSHSRDSTFSAAAASSVVTWAPTEPDAFSISMKIFSSSLNTWVESIGIMDTGCEGGNFISSSFLAEHLNMSSGDVQTDPDAEAMQFVDFGGKTDFKPLGKVKLKWYGRDIGLGGGRKGKRSLESEDWFRVAPHLSTEEGDAPFQVLLGKDWLHDNEVLTYRGLRLFKRKEKRSLETEQLFRQETVRRQALRDEAEAERLSQRTEVERLSERLADAMSVSTASGSGGYSPTISSSATPKVTPRSPRSSAQSVSSSVTLNSVQTNGLDDGVDAHGVS